MPQSIQFHHVSTNHDGEFSCSLFTRINSIERNFGFLYFTKNSYVISWDSLVDFSKIEEMALCKLPRKLNCGPTISSIDKARKQFKSECNILYSNGDEIFLYEINFADHTDEEEYYKILGSSQNISFIRYDVQCAERPSCFQYSTTIENERFIGNKRQFTEFAVRQPINQVFTESLLDFMVRTHKARAVLDGNINLTRSTEKIVEFISSKLDVQTLNCNRCEI